MSKSPNRRLRHYLWDQCPFCCRCGHPIASPDWWRTPNGKFVLDDELCTLEHVIPAWRFRVGLNKEQEQHLALSHYGCNTAHAQLEKEVAWKYYSQFFYFLDNIRKTEDPCYKEETDPKARSMRERERFRMLIDYIRELNLKED